MHAHRQTDKQKRTIRETHLHIPSNNLHHQPPFLTYLYLTRPNLILDDVDDADDGTLDLEDSTAVSNSPKKEKEELTVALAAVLLQPLRFSESSSNGSKALISAVTGQISTNGLMIINENGEEERRTVTSIFCGAERCRR